jgi:hypothetical protein
MDKLIEHQLLTSLAFGVGILPPFLWYCWKIDNRDESSVARSILLFSLCVWLFFEAKKCPYLKSPEGGGLRTGAS